MTDLVTDAAIDAASEMVNRSPLNEDPLIPALNAAAPYIAAEALRQAAVKFLADCNSAQRNSPDPLKFRCTCPYDSLMVMVRMLEIDAELERE